jgi:integrase
MSVSWFPQRNRWRIEITREGKRIRRYAEAGATKAEAQQLEAKIVRELWLGTLGKKPEYTLEEAFTRWVQEEMPTLKSADDAKNHAWHILPYIKNRKLTDAPDVAREYTAKNKHLKPATIYQRLAILRRVCNLAFKKWSWLDTPVGEKIQMPTVNNARHVYLTYDEVLSLLIAADKQHTEDAILLACYTGMRLGEVCELQPPRDGVFYLTDTKNGEARAVPMHACLIDAASRLPLPVKKSAIQHCFERARKAVGLDHVHAHDLRHTFASWLVQMDVPLYTAGALLGHKSTKTTQRYAHLAVENLRQAVGKL